MSAAFYHALTPAEVATLLPALLTAFNRASGQSDLLRYAAGEPENALPVASQRVDEGAVERLASAMTEGRVWSVDFHERAPSERAAAELGNLYFKLTPGSARRQIEVPYEALVFLSRHLVASTTALVSALSEIAELLGASYAFVHAGRDGEMVQREALAMAATSFYVEPSREEREWANRLDHIQMQRQLLGSERIRGAYWGTFLGSHFVERLGGLPQVRASAPVDKVEELSGGITYLQLTPDVWDYGRWGFSRKLARLERYLEPISLLSVERIPTPLRFAKWDRSTRT